MDRRHLLRVFSTAITTVCLLWYHYSYFIKDAVHESSLSGRNYIEEILIGNSQNCFNLFRMDTGCFMLLANELRRRKFLKDSRLVNVEEQLAIFLFTLGHSERNRVMQDRFQHSGETISRHFNRTLDAILKLSKYYIKPSNGDIPPEIEKNPTFYPYFKVNFQIIYSYILSVDV